VPAVGVSRTGIITGEGMSQEFHTIRTSTWTVTSGSRKKMPNGRCSSETLNGTYSLHGQGRVGNPLVPPLAAVVQVGFITFDGHGGLEGGETVNVNGEGEHNTFTGGEQPTTVQAARVAIERGPPDCRPTVVDNSGAAPIIGRSARARRRR
jgi:hypothetical protein